MLWKYNAQTLSLVINRAPHREGSGAHKRQKYCMEVLRESGPPWLTTHIMDLACDRPDGTLLRNSKDALDCDPPLPSVREMMKYGIDYGSDWVGVAVSDLIFTSEAWKPFQETEVNVIVARASQIPDRDESDRIVAVPVKKWNPLSLDALFIRGEAQEVFMRDFPDVFLAEYWDDAVQAWVRRHRKRLGLCVLSDHETMHRVHDPGWAQEVEYIQGEPLGLRPVGIYNRTKVSEFKEARRK